MKKFQGPLRTDNVDMHLYIYMAFEYIGIYDGMKTADRIKYLGLGYQIFDNHGKGFFGYQQFHTKRIKKMGFVEFIFRTLLIVLAFFCFEADHRFAWWSIAILFGATLFRKFIFHIKSKENFLLVNGILEGEKGFSNMVELLKIPREQTEEFDAFANRLSRIKISDRENLHVSEIAIKVKGASLINKETFDKQVSFEDQLTSIKEQKNLFNTMPMEEVLDYFQFFWKDIAKGNIPLLDKSDFILFINSAFLGKPLVNKLVFSKVRVVLVYDIFYQFYLESIKKYYDEKYLRKPYYAKLIVDNFTGFDLEKTLNNFRPKGKGGILDIMKAQSNKEHSDK